MTSAQRIARTPQFLAVVQDASALSPKMRRLTLTAPEITAQAWPLASDIAIVLTGEDSREVRRRYTVRSVTADALVVDAVLHGDGVGASWAAQATPGDHVNFHGPRGEIALPQADHVVAVTDEAGLPAIAALLEATDRPAYVIAEIADDAERYPLPANAEVRWLPRAGHEPGDPGLMIAAIADLADTRSASQAYPLSDGQAYAISESRAVLAVREALIGAGIDRERIYAKGYWNLRSRGTR
jgi:NADPH-dependent ferric siderophore reductase